MLRTRNRSRGGGAVTPWYNQQPASGVNPSLFLDFTNNRYAANGIVYPRTSLLTFTRASVAKYFDISGILRTAAVDEMRFEWISGVAQGLKNEAAATNLLLYSNDLNHATWVKVNCAAYINAIGPDNLASSASTLTATAANATCLQTIVLAAAARSYSVYLKRKTGTGAVSICRDGVTFTDVTSLINSSTWVKVKIENTSVLNPVCGIKLTTSGDEVYVYGNQDEVGVESTSQITTSSAAATRSAESPFNNNSNTVRFQDWFSATGKGCVYHEAMYSSVSATSARIYDMNNGVGSDAFLASVTPTPSGVMTYTKQGAGDQASFSFTPTINTFFKVAQTADTNSANASFNGVIAGADDTSVTLTTTATTLRLCDRMDLARPFNGYIREIRYYPTRVSNSELERITT